MPKTPLCLNVPWPPSQGYRRQTEYLAMQANRNQVAGMGVVSGRCFPFRDPGRVGSFACGFVDGLPHYFLVWLAVVRLRVEWGRGGF